MHAVELLVQRHFFSSLMMLCCCVLHVLKHFVHGKCCVEDMFSHLQLLEWRPRTKASFSHLLEFEGRLARKLRFHTFKSWNLTETSHETLVFTHHGCDLKYLNVRICTKHFFRVNGASAAEKIWLACATVSGVAALA